jgi:hypothetical protein
MAQPTKLTEELHEAMIRHLELGTPVRRSVKLVGISHQTHYNWLERGQAERDRLAGDARARMREGERPYVDYLDAVQRAEENAYFRNLVIIQQAARGGTEFETNTIETFHPDGKIKSRRTVRRKQPPQWQAAAWYLERRHPDEYARTVKGEMTGKGGGPISYNAMTKEEYKEALRENLGNAQHLMGAFLGEDDLV